MGTKKRKASPGKAGNSRRDAGKIKADTKRDYNPISSSLSSAWDSDALADLIIAEVQEQQANTPEDWLEARLKWFDAHRRFFNYGGMPISPRH